MARVNSVVLQAAALPVKNGKLCLVLSGRGNNWVLPKGRIEPTETAEDAALREAWEEAGLLGNLRKDPIGTYSYEKAGREYVVTVFVMRVRSMSSEWPESSRRLRCWVAPTNAPLLVGAGRLRAFVRRVLQTAVLE